MKLLIVDDQLATLKGLHMNIDWEAEGFTEVIAAQNAMEARLAFRERVPDIIICDIEMPVESGIDLCRWVREKEYHTEIIFLTCHSEFSYAKEAIELSALDYVLQPAPYEDIVTVVRKAISVVKEKRRHEDTQLKARAYEDNRNYICQKMWNDFLIGVCQAERLLETVTLPNPQKEIQLLLLQLVRWNEQKIDWDESSITEGLSNLLNYVFRDNEYYTVLTPVEPDIYAFIIQKKESKPIDPDKMLQHIKYLCSSVDMYMSCKLACYMIQASMLEELPELWRKLRKIQEKNIACKDYPFLNH